MARLVSYKARDDNRYSTFGNENECNSSENLTEQRKKIKIILSKKGKKKNKTNLVKTSTKSVPSAMSSTSRKSTVNASRQGAQSGRQQSTEKKSKCSCSAVGRCFDYLCCCFCCTNKRCKLTRWMTGQNVDEEDDIDAYFESYKNEMKLKENQQLEMKTRNDNAYQSPFTSTSNGKNESMTLPNATRRKYWNWNDSLKSNSDKFLETLEYDMDGEESLKRNHRYTVIPYMKGSRFFY